VECNFPKPQGELLQFTLIFNIILISNSGGYFVIFFKKKGNFGNEILKAHPWKPKAS
jgi:hypothetical protein